MAAPVVNPRPAADLVALVLLTGLAIAVVVWLVVLLALGPG